MAERFICAYTVASGTLSGLIGSNAHSGVEVLDKLDPHRLQDVTMTLDLDKEGLALLLDEIYSGELREESAYAYLRALEPLLLAHCNELQPDIELVLTYYLPNDSFGCWNPVLSKLGLPTLAKVFGETTLAFPFETVSDVAWPAVTGLTPSQLHVLRDELGSPWQDRLAALSPSLLVDDLDITADEMREELEIGLETFTQWVEAALTRDEGLVVWMDGDQ